MKIAIIGGVAKESGGLLKLGREWHFWCLNACMPKWLSPRYVRIDKWFHLHKRSVLERAIPEHLEQFESWANEHDEMEFVLLERWHELPNAVILPRADLEAMPRGGYHCGSFDWMVAYAIMLGATELFLTGISLHRESGEPMSSGPCLEYWCGYAEGRGIKVTAASDCDLFWNYRLVRDRRMYGYDDFDLVETVT